MTCKSNCSWPEAKKREKRRDTEKTKFVTSLISFVVTLSEGKKDKFMREVIL